MTHIELRNIALGLLHGDMVSDWDTSCDTPLPTISEIEYLLWQIRDIGMFVGKKEEALTTTTTKNAPEDPLIFTHFNTLTKEEALQVAEMFLRYHTFLNTYAEIEISHT